jgi:hypothetical protein
MNFIFVETVDEVFRAALEEHPVESPPEPAPAPSQEAVAAVAAPPPQKSRKRKPRTHDESAAG